MKEDECKKKIDEEEGATVFKGNNTTTKRKFSKITKNQTFFDSVLRQLESQKYNAVLWNIFKIRYH